MVFMWTDDIKGDDTYHKFVYLLLPHLQHITVHTDNNYSVLIYMRHSFYNFYCPVLYKPKQRYNLNRFEVTHWTSKISFP